MPIVKQTIRWNKDKRQTGLARVTQGQLFWHLTLKLERDDGRVDDCRMISIISLEERGWGRGGTTRGPYKFELFIPATGKRRRSTEQWDDMTEAKAAADVWYKQHKDTELIQSIIQHCIKRFDPAAESAEVDPKS